MAVPIGGLFAAEAADAQVDVAGLRWVGFQVGPAGGALGFDLFVGGLERGDIRRVVLVDGLNGSQGGGIRRDGVGIQFPSGRPLGKRLRFFPSWKAAISSALPTSRTLCISNSP